MTFGRGEILVWLWLIVPVVMLWALAWRLAAKRLHTLYAGHSSTMAPGQPGKGEWLLRGILMTVAVVCMIVAWAQPRWGFEWQESKRQGVDIMVAVDVSRSMLAEDISPNRLQRAKRELVDLLTLLKGDRVGLIAFAGVGFVQCPLTVDYGALRMFLDFLSADLIPVQGTAIADAIRLGIESLAESSPDTSAGKAMIVISDGEEHDESIGEVITMAKDAGVRIFTIGVGQVEGAPIPEAGGGFKKDSAGNMVLSKLNESILKQIADETGGAYVRSEAGDMDLDQIYLQGIKGTLEDRELEVVRQKLWYERFQWAVGVAWVLLLMEFLWGFRQRRQAGQMSLPTSNAAAVRLLVGLLAGATIVWSGDAIASVRGAHKAFERQEYDKAAELFQAAEVDDPEDATLTYNRAVAQYKAGKFNEAAAGFAKAAELGGKELQLDALFNAGNALARAGKLQEAIAAYDESLKLNPDQTHVKENRQVVAKLLEEQEKQEKENKENEQQDQKDQQDQQDQDQDSQEHQQGDQNQQSKQDGAPQPGKQPSSAPQPQPSGQAAPPTPQPQQGEESAAEKNGKEGGEGQQGNDEPPPDGSAQRMRPEEAEKLLRGVQDRAQKYMVPPMDQQQRGRGSRQQNKDW